MPIKESEDSAFNIAVEYLKEINNSLRLCKFYASRNDPEGWMTWLRIVFRELSAKLKETECKEFEKKFQKIIQRMNDKVKLVNEKREILYDLDQLEIKIRQRLQKKKMLLPSKSDPRFAVTER